MENIIVHTVGIGERGAAPRIGGRAVVHLDEKTLRAVAAATGGEYFYAAETPELEQAYASLGSQISWVEERTEVTALVSALGTFFVMAGALLSLGWFQKLP